MASRSVTTSYAGSAATEVVAEVLGQRAVAAADEEPGPPAVPAVAVDGDHLVDVVEEGGEGRGLGRIDEGRGDVPLEVGRLVDAVVRRAGASAAACAMTSVASSREPPW